MKRKTDRAMPIGKLRPIEDVLPPPEQLQMPAPTVKVTIALSQSSVNFFKREARKHHTQYQKMIRQVLDKYTNHYRVR